ncbi:CynX/NimT family MFS transporter [Streptomyces sp. TP-A0356]|uniref:MFS transporter n=1 Tax=Streptomyces sp. TP-A0356 TaxID=1359208 RepID=UPI0006E45F0F|nr:MFS transporter [Streptomyces sp. TP-A0356]
MTSGTPDIDDIAGESGPPVARSTHWPSLLMVYSAGVTAAMGLGKFSVATDSLRGDLRIGLGELGWVISAVTAVSALLGTPVGLRLGRMSTRVILVAGTWTVAVAGAAGALATSLGGLLPIRAVEGVGYLMVVIACPTLVVRLCAPRDQSRALALWGTFVPVGLALSTALGGAVGEAVGWRGWMLVVAGITAVPAVVLTFTRIGVEVPGAPLPQRPKGARRRLRHARPVILLALGFCMASLVTVAIFALLPTFLERELGRSGSDAGATAGLISLVSVGGGLLIGWLLHRNPDRRPVLLCSLLAVVAAWTAFRPGGPAALFLAGATVISAINGILVGMILALVPRLVDDPGEIGLANGIVTQGGSLGSLLGPPLFNLGVEDWDWTAVGWLTTVGMAVCWLFLSLALRPPRHVPRLRAGA